MRRYLLSPQEVEVEVKRIVSPPRELLEIPDVAERPNEHKTPNAKNIAKLRPRSAPFSAMPEPIVGGNRSGCPLRNAPARRAFPNNFRDFCQISPLATDPPSCTLGRAVFAPIGRERPGSEKDRARLKYQPAEFTPVAKQWA